MTDPADRHLEERLHALARGVGVPAVPPADDVRRGRRRLVRMRVAMAGATTGTLAVVLGITSLTAGDPKATETPEITQPTTTVPTTPGSSEDTTTGGKRPGNGGSARIGGASVDDPTSHDTASADPGGPPAGVPVKNAPTGSATGDPTHHPAAGQHHFEGGPSADPTEAPTTTPSGTPTSTPSSTPTPTPTETPTATPTVPPTGSTKIRVPQVLRYYNDVLSERLDSDRAHLQPYDRTVDTKETRSSNGHLYALGATFRWSGRSPSSLQITVASGWDQVDWDCGASYSAWSCHTGASTGSEVARHDGVLQVAVEHASGQVVVLTAGNQGATEADLVAAAADERLILPGVAPVAPATIDAGTFAAAGLAALVKTGETFQQNGIDRTPWVRGAWTGTGAEHGTLSWSVAPIYSDGGFTCLTTYRSCSEVTVEGTATTVHLAQLKPKAGGGWLVQYDGGAYGVRVYSSSRAFPKKRAYAFVIQPAWQPAGEPR